MELQLALGRAVAEQRRRHGLSQPELARMLDRPVAWVSRLERGLGQSDPMSVLEAVASALGTPLPGRNGACRGSVVNATAACALRLVLNAGRQGRPGADAPRTAGWLHAQTDQAWALTCARRYGELAELLAVLLPELDRAAAAAAACQRADICALQSVSYQACSVALAKLGQHDSAKTAASRALSAAQRGGNLLLAAVSAYLLARIHIESGRYACADETARKASAALSQPGIECRQDAMALRGALTLQRALIAARAGYPGAAREQLGLARELAERLNRAGRHVPDDGFGPGHVALYEVAVSIESAR